MPSVNTNSMVGPFQLIRVLEEFTETVSQYLIPVVRYVGHKDTAYEGISRRFSGLIHEKQYSGEPAHLVIFDHIPRNVLQNPSTIDANTAYVFCLDEPDKYTKEELKLLKNRISITLINPEIDILMWHIKALLLLQDISFSNEHSPHISMMSIHSAYRGVISTIIAGVFNKQSYVISLYAKSIVNEMCEFLFGMMSPAIAPIQIKPTTLDIKSLSTDRISLINATEISISKLNILIDAVNKSKYKRQIIILTTAQIESSIKPDGNLIYTRINNLEKRSLDAHLLAYWCAAKHTHRLQKFNYYSTKHIDYTRNKSKNNPSTFLNSLSKTAPDVSNPPEILVELINTYNRLCMDDILSEAELRIMLKLRMNSEIIESASSAAGIPQVTWHKRMRRLTKKSSLINILSNNQDN